eukprot:1856961-Rhodomonas_salina.4
MAVRVGAYVGHVGDELQEVVGGGEEAHRYRVGPYTDPPAEVPARETTQYKSTHPLVQVYPSSGTRRGVEWYKSTHFRPQLSTSLPSQAHR